MAEIGGWPMWFRSKLNVFAGLGVAVLLIGILMLNLGVARTWHLWNVQDGYVTFMDLRVVTAGAESHREGFDPMYRNPHDFIQRLVNYPRLWQAAYVFPIDESDTVWLGFACLGLFVVTLFLALPPLSNAGVLGLLVALLSPAMMLGYERGNTDLVVFAVLALAVAASRHALSSVLVLFAFALKLFPFAAFTVLLGFGRRAASRWFVGAMAFAGFYAAFYFDDLVQIVATTPRGIWLSFGRNVVAMKLASDGVAWAPVVQGAATVAALAWVVFALSRWWRAQDDRSGPDNAGMRGFRIGAACFVGTFLIGTNFAYKLVFVLLALPQLMEWARGAQDSLRWAARAALAGTYLALWMPMFEWVGSDARVGSGLAFWTAQGAHWLLFGAAVWLLVRTAPAWLRDWLKNKTSDEVRA